MKDATGREIKKGMAVELPMNGMFVGYVIEIIETQLHLSGSHQPPPPQVIIQVITNRVVNPASGRLPTIYIVNENSDPNLTDQSPGRDDGGSNDKVN